MDFLQIFQTNAPAVVSEIFDDEVVIINMESGTYYSLAQSGVVLWQQLQHGTTLSDLIAQVSSAYAISPGEITPSVQQFMTELVQEQLIIPTVAPIKVIDRQATSILPTAPLQQCFTPPLLNKFTDMQDLLLLDPIHEVDAGGWPRK